MDGYQRGIGAADVAPMFAAYEAFLADALPEVERARRASPRPIRPPARSRSPRRRSCAGTSPHGWAGFRRTPGSTSSAHPFSGGTPTDVRITTRYREDDFRSAILAVVHETGHALYERGLPAATRASRSAKPPAWRRTKASR